MASPRTIFWLRFAVAVNCLAALPCHAQRTESLRGRAVDVVLLKGGTRLLGTVIDARRDEYVTLMMRGTWLQREYPDALQHWQTQQTETDGQDAPRTDIQILQQEIDRLEDLPETTLEHVGYLKEKLTSLQAAESRQPDVVVLKIPSKQIRRQLLQSRTRRQLAGLGVLNDIEGTEEFAERDLKGKLEENGALIRQLPDATGGLSRTDRIILDAELIFGQTLKLVGYQNRYFAADDEQAISEIMPQMLHAGLQNQLSGLLADINNVKPATAQSDSQPNENSILPPAATAIVQQKNANIVELSTMNMNLQNGTADVFIDLYRPDENGKRRFALRATGRATSAEINDSQIAQITRDPRVQQIQSIAQSLNVNANFRSAVAMGAVVEKAQQRARSSLQEVLSGGNSDGLVVRRCVLEDQPKADAQPAAAE